MAEANKKQNFFVRAWSGLKRYCREMKSELKKVVWPTKNQVVNNTLVVLLCCLVVGAFVWIFDLAAGKAVQALISLLS